MDYEVVTTDGFERDAKRLAKKYPSLQDDLFSLNESLKQDPQQGDSLGKVATKYDYQ